MNPQDSNNQMPEQGQVPGLEGSMSGAMPGDMSSEQMASPEEMAALKDKMDEIEAKYRDMNAQSFANKNQSDSFKQDLLVEVFKAMQDAGIDVSDVNSVKQFLDQLQQSNPDLYEIFIEAFNGLLGEDTSATDTSGSPVTLPTSLTGGAPTGQTSPAAPADMGVVPSSDALAGMIPGGGQQASPAPAAGDLTKRFPNLAGQNQ